MTVALAVQKPGSRSPAREIDDVTLARARRGDAAACRALVVCYQRAVFAHLSRMVGPSGQAALVEDLAQETFLRVFRALPSFSPTGPARPSTWILTIATRVAIDLLRKARPQVSLEHAELSSSERTDAGAERRQLRDRLERALDTLSPEMRAAFVLRAFHEWSHDEIAAALEVEVGTVKSRISRARERLKQALEDGHDAG